MKTNTLSIRCNGHRVTHCVQSLATSSMPEVTMEGNSGHIGGTKNIANEVTMLEAHDKIIIIKVM